MKRKTVKQGSGTMTISLPKEWTEKNSIKSGTELQIEEQGKTIMVSIDKTKTFKTFEINTSTKKLMTDRAIQNAYNQGYDEIKINYDNPKELIKIKKVANELIGFELTEETNKHCILKELTEIKQLEFDTIFRRLFRIINGMAQEGLVAIQEKNKAELDNIIGRDTDVNKFSNLCIRYLNKIGYPQPEKTSTYITICYNLEIISDAYKELLIYARDSNKYIEEYVQLIQKTNELFNKSYEFTFQKTDQKANETAQEYEKLKKELKNDKYTDTQITNPLKKIQNLTITIPELQITYCK